MKAQDATAGNPKTCHPNPSLAEATQMIRTNDCASLSFVDDAIGIVADCDRPVLALVGDLSEECNLISRAAAEFGWATAVCNGRDELAALCERARVVGVLLHVQDCLAEDGWQWAFRAWSRGTRVRPIACWRPAQRLNSEDFQRLGAYDALMRPLCAGEVRLSLGFLAQAVAGDSNDSPRRIARPARSRVLSGARESACAVSAA